MGLLKDKPYKTLLPLLFPLASHFLFTTPPHERARPPEDLAGFVEGQGKPCRVVTLEHSLLEAVEWGTHICICGSLYLLGALRGRLVQLAA